MLSIEVDGDRVVGVSTERGTIASPVVVDVAGAWAPELARTVGLDVPVRPWRHDTAFLGLPDGRDASFPIVLDNGNQVYFRPEGREQMLAGVETANELGGDPDRPFEPIDAEVSRSIVSRVCERVPWMVNGSLRGTFAGQDGMTPDQRAIIDRVGPDGFYLLCGFSGTGFKTAPAIGAHVSDWIVDGGRTARGHRPVHLAPVRRRRAPRRAAPIWAPLAVNNGPFVSDSFDAAMPGLRSVRGTNHRPSRQPAWEEYRFGRRAGREAEDEAADRARDALRVRSTTP